MEQLKQWLSPPHFADYDQTYRARILHTFLLSSWLIAVFYAIFILLFVRERLNRVPIIFLAIIFISMAYYLLRRQYVYWASLAFVGAVWATVALATFTGGGVQGIAFPAFVVVILAAGILLDIRYGFVFIILSATVALVTIYLQQEDLLPLAEPPSLLTIGATQVALFIVVIVALYLTAGTINESLRRAQQELAERQQAEIALRHSEERYRRLINEAQDAVVTISADGTLSSISPAFERMTGWPAAEWVDQSFLDLIHADDVGRLRKRSRRLIDGETIVPANYRLRTKLGRYIHVELSTTLQSAEGAEPSFLSIIRDVTQRQKMEEALREAQKLDSLGMLAGGVAHDFNNLLVAILGQTSLALYQLPVTNPARRPIEKAVHASERAADLTRQLLAYSGRGKFVVQAINLNELVQENIHLFNVVIPKHITLRLEMSPTLYPIEADTGQMQQIVMNLLLNAVQAIADKAGSVTIVTSMQHITETDSRYWQHTSQALAPGHYVTLEVHDTGYGMAEVVKSRIFDPFFTTKAEGRGLGLAAVLGIVRGHQGGIRVYSEAGQGTTFKLLFPVAQSEQLPKEDKPEIQPIPKKGVVLVIDDEAAVREAVNDILSDLGLEVIAAPNGESGLALFQERREEIELVLLDLSMPGLSGEDTFRALREIAPNVRVILSSGYNEAEATRRFVGKGLAGFLQKPYDINALISKVQHYL